MQTCHRTDHATCGAAVRGDDDGHYHSSVVVASQKVVVQTSCDHRTHHDQRNHRPIDRPSFGFVGWQHHDDGDYDSILHKIDPRILAQRRTQTRQKDRETDQTRKSLAQRDREDTRRKTDGHVRAAVAREDCRVVVVLVLVDDTALVDGDPTRVRRLGQSW